MGANVPGESPRYTEPSESGRGRRRDRGQRPSSRDQFQAEVERRGADEAPEYSFAPERVVEEFSRNTQRLLENEHHLELPGDTRQLLDQYLEAFGGQVYNNINSNVRKEMVMGPGVYDPRHFDAAVQERTVEQLTRVETTVAQIINHIAGNIGEIHTGNDLRTGQTLQPEELSYVVVVLSNITDDIAEGNNAYVDLIHAISMGGVMNERDVELTYGVLATMPEDGFEQALQGAYDGMLNRTAADEYNRGATLLALMNRDQELQLIQQGLATITAENVDQRIRVIKNIALHLDTPWVTISGLIDEHIANGGQFESQLRGLQQYVNENITRVAQEREAARERVAEAMAKLDAFRISRPFEDPSRIAGFAMTYWGVATALANTILAAVNGGGPMAALNNIHVAALGAGVAYTGATKVGGRNGLESVIYDFAQRFSLSEDERNAIETENWVKLTSDIYEGANTNAVEVMTSDEFIQTIVSMDEHTAEGNLILFDKDSFLNKLRSYHPATYAAFMEHYGNDFANNPDGLEKNLNLLANAFNELNINDNLSFREHPDLRFGSPSSTTT